MKSSAIAEKLWGLVQNHLVVRGYYDADRDTVLEVFHLLSPDKMVNISYHCTSIEPWVSLRITELKLDGFCNEVDTWYSNIRVWQNDNPVVVGRIISSHSVITTRFAGTAKLSHILFRDAFAYIQGAIDESARLEKICEDLPDEPETIQMRIRKLRKEQLGEWHDLT